MGRVAGIGGFFFRARNPETLAIWYQERLGVKTAPETYDEGAWRQEAGETVFAPFRQDSEMIGPPEVRDPEGNGIQLWQPMGPE